MTACHENVFDQSQNAAIVARLIVSPRIRFPLNVEVSAINADLVAPFLLPFFQFLTRQYPNLLLYQRLNLPS